MQSQDGATIPEEESYQIRSDWIGGGEQLAEGIL